MAKEEDEAPKESAEDEKAVVQPIQIRSSPLGVWGNTVSSRAPVTGMITNGYSEGPGDVLAR